MCNQKPPTHKELHALYQSIDLGRQQRTDHRSPREQNRTRMHRALSWLKRCEEMRDKDIDERFLFLWIAFNAAYGDDRTLNPSKNPGDTKSEHNKLRDFLRQIVVRDKGYRLADIIRRHNKKFRTIIDNRFLNHLFWRAEYNPQIRSNWKQKFVREKQSAHKALDDKHLETNQTIEVLHLTFNRLYTLRNQILHGSATWRSGYNRNSLESGNAILGLLIPEILKSMLDAIKERPDMDDWGSIAYPPYLETPDDTTEGPPRTTV